jgi:hypothetical protein
VAGFPVVSFAPEKYGGSDGAADADGAAAADADGAAAADADGAGVWAAAKPVAIMQ